MTEPLMRWVDIFDMDTSTGDTDWSFTMPGVALSGGGTRLDYIGPVTRVTQIRDGRTYIGEGDSHPEAILALIANIYRGHTREETS